MASKSPRIEYQVSTPRFTCWVAVQDGTVIGCAPYLRRTTLGQPWDQVSERLGALPGARITILSQERHR